MKPIKQTVYLPVKDKMSYFTVMEDFEYKTGVDEAKGYFFTPEQLNEYTANVIKQALENAAEKVKVKEARSFTGVRIGSFFASKESITNTFEETFKLFFVSL